MRIVISYDITDSRKRTRVSRTLEGYAERVQRSVFEGEMSSQQLQRLRKRLSRIKLGPDDSIRYYGLCGACAEKVGIDGAGEVVRAPKHFII